MPTVIVMHEYYVACAHSVHVSTLHLPNYMRLHGRNTLELAGHAGWGSERAKRFVWLCLVVVGITVACYRCVIYLQAC